MGGGKKQNQRTKGNVKPSSSSRAAEMLVQDGRTGFIGFGGLSETLGNSFGYVPKSFGGAEEGEHDIDSELRILMRKMGKKDTVTRLKAVQEFSQLCSQKEVEDVAKILSFWPRIYNKLSEDYDHRVREATQLAHLEIVTKVGRRLAPQLKMIVSSWLKSQFDQYPPAASAAKKAFDVTFPGQKSKDALTFCKKDLLLNIQDLLIKQTKDTISDPKNVPEEEREAKYNRLISSTLLSMGYIMEILSQDDNSDLTELYHSIFQEKKFWKFSRHSSPLIRGAFFSATSSACQFNTEVLQGYNSVICPTVMCCLDESDPTVVGTYWECLLLVVSTFEDCWTHVNARKAVLPKLWSVLRKGGFGSASIIFPNVLPFLSKIPKSIFGESLGFAKEFFTNIKDGLVSDRAVASHSESVAVMKSYMECLRFMLFNSETKEEPEAGKEEEMGSEIAVEENTEILEYLINEELKALVDKVLEDKKYHWRKTFLAALKDLVLFLEKRETTVTNNIYDRALDKIHKLLYKATMALLSYDDSITAVDGNVKRKFKSLEELIKIIVFDLRPTVEMPQRQVMFSGNVPDSENSNEKLVSELHQHLIEQHSDDTTSQNTSLSDWKQTLLKDISSNCVELLFKRKNILYMEFMSKIISCVNFKTDFLSMLECMLSARSNCQETDDATKGPTGIDHTRSFNQLGHDLIDKIIIPIMEFDFSLHTRYWKSQECQIAVIDLLCRLFVLLDEDKKLDCLCRVKEISAGPFMFCMLVEKVLKVLDASVVKSWFNESDLWAQLISFVTLCSDMEQSDAQSPSVINSVFSCVELCLFFNDGSLCKENQTENLFLILKNTLLSFTPGNDSFVCERALSLIGNFYKNTIAEKTLPTVTADLLLAVFQFIIKVQDNELGDIASGTFKSGMLCLLSSTRTSSHGSLENLLQKIAYWVQKSCNGTEDNAKILHLAACSGKVIDYLNTKKPEYSVENYVQSFIKQLLCNLRLPLVDQSIFVKENILDAVLSGKLSIVDLPTGLISDVNECHSSLGPASFAISLMNSLNSLDFEQGILFTAIMDSLDVLCAIGQSSISGNDDEKEAENTPISSELIEKSIKALLAKENLPLKELLDAALDRSLLNGGIATLSFERLYDLIPPSYISENPISDLLGCVMSRGTNDAKSVDAMKMLLANLEDLSMTRAMVEQFVDQLAGEINEGVENFNHTLDLCTTVLIRWQNMLQEGKERSDDFADVIQTIITILVEWRDNSNDVLLFSVDLNEATDVQLAFNLNLMKLLSFVLECGGGEKLQGTHWDFVLCSLASWIQTCADNSFAITGSIQKMLFSFWAFNLCSSVTKAFDVAIGAPGFATTVANPTMECKMPWKINSFWKQQRKWQFVSDDLLTEWQEFFTPAIFRGIFELYQKLLMKPADKSDSNKAHRKMFSHLLNSVCCALIGMPSTLLVDILLEAKTMEEQLKQGDGSGAMQSDERNLSGSQIQVIQKEFCMFIDQLKSENSFLQLLAHTFLCKLMVVSRSTILSMTTESIEGDECDVIRSLPEKQYEVLESCQAELLSYLDETSVTFGSYLIEAPPKELSHYILAFLVSWQITLQQFRDAEPDQRAAYANFFRKRNLIGPLLKILFSILPHDKGHLLSDDIVVMKSDELSLRTMRQYAFHVYLSALECIPALIRSWCNNNLDKKSASVLDRFTTSFASPILCSREIEQVSNSSKTFTNMEIKTRPAAREVVAVYTVEEISMELVVKMSPSHPLGPVVVECGKRVGVTSAQWRQWMLQLTMYLTQQNGTIVDGLSLWKRNVDKKFEGVEECMICFSVVHGTNYQLPTITCRVCKKKFHSACLYKWFNTSNKSTCPLCRNSF